METSRLDFSGRVVLVTGGSRGLGKAIAAAFGRLGAQVATCGRKEEALSRTSGDFHSLGLDIFTHPAHMGRPEDVDTLFGAVTARYGKLDILVNNVGMNILTPAVSEASESLWDKIMETNLKSAFLASSRAVPLMRKAGGGRIINISSIAARKATMGMGIYCIAKAGLEMLTRVLAIELAQDRITVNAVAPGMVRTPFSRPFWGDADLLRQITAAIPQGRIAEPEDIIGTVLFLASDLADFVTGETITVDGGASA